MLVTAGGAATSAAATPAWIWHNTPTATGTGDLTIIASMTLTSWTPTTGHIAGQHESANPAWRLLWLTAGKPQLKLWDDLSVLHTYDAVGTAWTLTDGEPLWLRVIYTAATGVVTFDPSSDSPLTDHGSVTWDTGSRLSSTADIITRNNPSVSLVVGTRTNGGGAGTEGLPMTLHQLHVDDGATPVVGLDVSQLEPGHPPFVADTVTGKWVLRDAAALTPMWRDPVDWPYQSRSIWNMPIGADATMVAGGFTPPTQAGTPVKSIVPEEDIIINDAGGANDDIWDHDGAWLGDNAECPHHAATSSPFNEHPQAAGHQPGRERWKHILTNSGVATTIPKDDPKVLFSAPIPAGWATDNAAQTPSIPNDGGAYIGHASQTGKPNSAASILKTINGEVVGLETQPFHIVHGRSTTSPWNVPDYAAISGNHNPTWHASEAGFNIETGGMGPEQGHHGAHGGGRISARGGTVRVGELTNAANSVAGINYIPHALKWVASNNTDLNDAYGNNTSGYVWPAVKADSNYDSPGANNYYGGTGPAQMGSLLALTWAFNVDGLNTELGKIIARTLQRYGAYVCDVTTRAANSIVWEWGPDGRVFSEINDLWGWYPDGLWDEVTTTDSEQGFYADMETIAGAMQVVVENAGSGITPSDYHVVGVRGGSGNRRAPWAPPFVDGTGSQPVGDALMGVM